MKLDPETSLFDQTALEARLQTNLRGVHPPHGVAQSARRRPPEAKRRAVPIVCDVIGLIALVAGFHALLILIGVASQ